MPVIKQAEKKLRHDRVVTKSNVPKKKHVRDVIKLMRKNPSAKHLQHAYQALDKAVKIHIIHKNKAARIKSRLSKLLKKA